MAEDCFIYVISERCADPKRDKVHCKVGVSTNPQSRLAQLQTGCPLPLHVYRTLRLPSRWMAYQVEQKYHKTKLPFATTGEWTRSFPFYALEEVGSYCAEHWFEQGLERYEVAELCDEAGVSCAAFVSMIPEMARLDP